MKNITVVCALSLLLVSCGKAPKENQPQASEMPAQESVSSAGEPITLHARLDFVDGLTSSAIHAQRQLNASIYLETDVLRQGSGASATYSLDTDVTRVQGAVRASGTLALNDGDVSSSETYNMQNEWNSLTSKPEGKFIINLPEESFIGEGLSVGVDIEAPVSGTKKATISSKGQTIDSDISHSRSMFCAPQADKKDQDICTLKFTIDAAPTKAKEAIYENLLENAKTVYANQGKKNPEGGVLMYSGMVPVYGANTQYHSGHFVTELNQQYAVNVDGADISQHIHLVVWSTKRGDKWQPEGLPPLQKPDALQ